METSIQPAKKKVLFVLYQFPPSNDVGAQRPVRFIRKLDRFGWEPHVIAPSNGVYSSYAADMLHAVRGRCTIYRTPMYFPSRNIRADYTGPPDAATFTAWRIWNRFAVPDGGMAWLPDAVRSGIRIVKRAGIHVVVASGQPFSSFIIAAMVASATRVGLVLDYRDPWTPNPFYKGVLLKRGIEHTMERHVLQRADAAVFTTDEARESYRKVFPGIVPRCHTVTNAFDREEAISSTPRPERFTLVHAGNLYGSRNPVALFHAVAQAISMDHRLSANLRIQFFGIYASASYKRLCNELGIGRVVEFYARLPRSELLTHLSGASVLLLINSYGSGHEVFIPSKFFEYLGYRKPILCLSEQGALKNVVERTGSGVVADPRNRDAIARQLIELHRRFHLQREDFFLEEDTIREYESSRTTERFAAVLDSVAVG